MSKIDYLPLEQITEELNSQVQALKTGHLSPAELSGLVKSARDVYERLVILEFQAHERSNQSHSSEADEEGHGDMPVMDLTEEIQNEVSEAPQEAFSDLFSSGTEEVSDNQIADDVVEAPDEVVEELVKDVEKAVEEKVLERAQVTSVEASEDVDPNESLAEKFENAPIEDISKSYSLNEKFQFIRVLTQNNSENFNMLVDRVNGSSSRSDALDAFTQAVKEPEDEDAKEVYDNFKELIIRRFS